MSELHLCHSILVIATDIDGLGVTGKGVAFFHMFQKQRSYFYSHSVSSILSIKRFSAGRMKVMIRRLLAQIYLCNIWIKASQ